MPGAALSTPLNMLGPQASQLTCPPVTQSPLHQTPPPAPTSAGLPALQHPTAPGMTPPQPAAPTQPSTPVSSSGQTPTPTPGSVPSASQTQSTPTVQAAAPAQVTPQPQTPVQPPSVATPQSSQQQPTPVHTQPPGTPVSLCLRQALCCSVVALMWWHDGSWCLPPRPLFLPSALELLG